MLSSASQSRDSADNTLIINSTKKLESVTNGNPRLINLTMERALMSAYLKQSKFLVNDDIETAAESLKLNEKTYAPSEKKK